MIISIPVSSRKSSGSTDRVCRIVPNVQGSGEASADFTEYRKEEMKALLPDPRNDDEKAVNRKNVYRKIGWCRLVSMHVADIHKSGSKQLRQSSEDRVAQLRSRVAGQTSA